MSQAAKMSSQQKRATAITEIINSGVRDRQQQRVTATPEINVSANTFYGIMFSDKLSPEQKKIEVAKALVFEGTKEENRVRIQEFEEFKEWLQSEREKMSTRIIELTDTETFSELQRVYRDLNDSLIDFNEKMQPLTDITDALYTLRTNGLTQDAFKEILEDEKLKDEFNKERNRIQGQLNGLYYETSDLKQKNHALSESKSFFGFGGIKEDAREKIAQNEAKIAANKQKEDELKTQLDTLVLNYKNRASQLGEHAALKSKLKELLDLTSEQHIERQKDLVNSALHFVKTGKERVGTVRTHLDKMIKQVDNLGDVNSHVLQVYAVLNEAIKDAEKSNQTKRQSYQKEDGVEEDMITRMRREDARMAIEQHIAMLDQSSADTIQTVADLTTQSIRIRNMRESTQGQIEKARMMHSRGIAGVADQLSSTLQAVNASALTESSAMARDTLNKMAQATNMIAQKESIRIAMGKDDVNNDLVRALEDLAQYGEVQKEATNITRESIIEMRNSLAELENLSKGVEQTFKEAVAVNADIGAGVTQTKKTTKSNTPFSL